MKDDGPRIAIVADIHHGQNDETKCGDDALELLDSVLNNVDEYKPDLLVDLGDRISDKSVAVDEKRMNEVADRFVDLKTPRVHIVGNHDVVNLSISQQASILHTDLSHQSLMIQGWNLLFWQPDTRSRNGVRAIPQHDLDWLRDEVSRSTYPAVLFTHMPIGGGSYDGNFYFSRNPSGEAEHTNAVEARKIVTGSDAMVLVVAGHSHWNTLNTVDGVHFVTLQSLTESFTTFPDPAKAWSTLDLGSKIRVSVYGNDPLKLELTPRRKGFHAMTRDQLT